MIIKYNKTILQAGKLKSNLQHPRKLIAQKI